MIPKLAGSALGFSLGFRVADIGFDAHGIGLGTELQTNAEWGRRMRNGADPEAHADSPQSMIPKRVGERGRVLAPNPSCGSRIRSERGIGLGTELRTNAESGMGIDPEAHAEAVANKNSEANLAARWEAGADSAAEALSNRISDSISESGTVRNPGLMSKR